MDTQNNRMEWKRSSNLNAKKWNERKTPAYRLKEKSEIHLVYFFVSQTTCTFFMTQFVMDECAMCTVQYIIRGTKSIKFVGM